MHQRDKRTLAGASLFEWFSTKVNPVDEFVRPNFNYGQFFYTAKTATRLVDAMDHYQQVCCLCTPRLAREWQQRGRTVDLLDCDNRFAELPGYRQFDLLSPEVIDKQYDCVIFDPVFLPAATLRAAVDAVIGDKQTAQTDLFITFPGQRGAELTRAFHDYGLRRLAFKLEYCNVKPAFQDEFKLFGTRELEVK